MFNNFFLRKNQNKSDQIQKSHGIIYRPGVGEIIIEWDEIPPKKSLEKDLPIRREYPNHPFRILKDTERESLLRLYWSELKRVGIDSHSL